MNKKAVSLVLAMAAASALLLAGCGTFQAWGEKSSGAPATFGGGVSIPLGKK